MEEQVKKTPEQEAEEKKMLAVQQGYILQELQEASDIEAVLALDTQEKALDFATDRLVAGMAVAVQKFMENTGNYQEALLIDNLVDSEKCKEVTLAFLEQNGFSYTIEDVHGFDREGNRLTRTYYSFELNNSNPVQTVKCKYISHDVRVFVLMAIHVIQMARQPLTDGTLTHYLRQVEIVRELGSVEKVQEVIAIYGEFLESQKSAQETIANVQQEQEEEQLLDAQQQQ